MAAPALAATQGQSACSSSERWHYSDGFWKSPSVREDFERTVAGRISPAESYAQALAFRKTSSSEEGRAFGEYWISRSFLEAKLFHLAALGFNVLVSREPAQMGIQQAALECLNVIQLKFPALTLTNPKSLVRFPDSVARREAAARAFLGGQDTLSLLTERDAYFYFAHVLSAARESKFSEVISNGEALLALHDFPQFIASKINTVRMILGRAYYGSGQFTKAVTQYIRIQRDSNELVHSLSELGWSHLMAGNYADAIGVGMGVQSGWMKKTFSPESLMVAAMALNEICQYPESLKMIGLYRRKYEKSYTWLKKILQDHRSADFYPTAISFVKNLKTDVPDPVVSEWIRSPVFIANQETINLIFEEQKRLASLEQELTARKAQIQKEVLQALADLKKRRDAGRAKGKDLTKELEPELTRLELKNDEAIKLALAAEKWKPISDANRHDIEAHKRRAIQEINVEFAALSERMFQQLEEVAENNDLIEVEVYNGASEDVVWQNAHPDYKSLIVQRTARRAPADAVAEVYNWGSSHSSLSGSSEVWEDELGSMKANVADNCSNEDRYLGVKAGKTDGN